MGYLYSTDSVDKQLWVVGWLFLCPKIELYPIWRSLVKIPLYVWLFKGEFCNYRLNLVFNFLGDSPIILGYLPYFDERAEFLQMFID